MFLTFLIFLPKPYAQKIMLNIIFLIWKIFRNEKIKFYTTLILNIVGNKQTA